MTMQISSTAEACSTCKHWHYWATLVGNANDEPARIGHCKGDVEIIKGSSVTREMVQGLTGHDFRCKMFEQK